MSNHLPLRIELEDQEIRGFCMRIHDDFYETYAVILDGYHSFSVWLDEKELCWKSSKYANLDTKVLEKVISFLKSTDEQQ